jgi:hypothetical protein
MKMKFSSKESNFLIKKVNKNQVQNEQGLCTIYLFFILKN